MSARPNLPVRRPTILFSRRLICRLLARLLRPLIVETLDMGGRAAPLPWPGRPAPAYLPIEGGGALFAGRPRLVPSIEPIGEPVIYVAGTTAHDDEFPASPEPKIFSVIFAEGGHD